MLPALRARAPPPKRLLLPAHAVAAMVRGRQRFCCGHDHEANDGAGLCPVRGERLRARRQALRAVHGPGRRVLLAARHLLLRDARPADEHNVRRVQPHLYRVHRRAARHADQSRPDPTPLCGRDARPRPARSARDGHTDRLRVVARELHRRLGRGALDALHVQAGRRDDWAAECGAAGDERRGVQRARRVSDQAAGCGVELPDGAGRVAVRGLVQLCRPGPGPRGARLVLEGVGRQVRRARERARSVRL
mmetsp:Transcript_47662/g.154668  ORF Transcript_47662/g.154668 Transcript_47662/m.154668 type:complete len:249 (+) Transcript_47662:289-1035(+)